MISGCAAMAPTKAVESHNQSSLASKPLAWSSPWVLESPIYALASGWQRFARVVGTGASSLLRPRRWCLYLIALATKSGEPLL